MSNLDSFVKIKGISKTFSTINNSQYKTIDEFWEELIPKYGLENLIGIGFGWADSTIYYMLTLKQGIIDGYNAEIELPKTGWKVKNGKTVNLSQIYDSIYKDGNLKYEVETFDRNGNCKIFYIRK